MTTEDKLRAAIESMAGGDVTTPHITRVIDRAAPQRRGGPRLAIVAASVAVLASAVWFLTSGGDTAPKPSASPTGLVLNGEKETECPGATDPSKWSDEELRDRGAADALPEYGTTSLEQVQAALAANRADLEARFPEATFAVGPGWGVSYSMTRGSAPAYHHVPDYAIYARYASREDCASEDFFVLYGIGRIPVRFVYPAEQTPSHHDYDLAGVTRVVVTGGLEVSIGEGKPSLKVDAESAVLPDVHVTVDGGQVTVRRQSPQDRQRKHVTVTIALPQLERVAAHGGVSLSTAPAVIGRQFRADLEGGVAWVGDFVTTPSKPIDAVIAATGGVDMDLSGSLGSLTYTGEGGTVLHAHDLRVGRLRVTVAGGSSADVTAYDAFDLASANGGASITYSGVAPSSPHHDISSSITAR
jgi:hypothetical protein